MFKTLETVLFMLIFSSCLLSTPALAADTKEANFYGHAYDIDSQSILYTEHHYYMTPTLHKVEYKEPNGDLFATKTIDYRHSFFAPDVTQTNFRNGEEIIIYREPICDDIGYQIRYQENAIESPESSTLKNRPNLVIDAGLNYFIKKNWDILLSPKALTVDYLIPSALDHYELTIQEQPCSSVVKDNQNESTHCFSISASSFFISLFSSQLELTYVKNTVTGDIQLMEFRGRSNISDQDGNYQDVNINYSYAEQ